METQNNPVTLKDTVIKNEPRTGQRESLEFCALDHQTWSTGSGRSHEDISLEECERIVLSPQPVPMNADMASEAINAAARRSNSSRTHSIKTQQLDSHGDASSDIQSQLSYQDLRQPILEKIQSLQLRSDCRIRHRPRFSWRRLFCCFVGRSKTYRLDGTKYPLPPAATPTPATTITTTNRNGETPCSDSRHSRMCRPSSEHETDGKEEPIFVTVPPPVGETGDQRIQPASAAVLPPVKAEMVRPPPSTGWGETNIAPVPATHPAPRVYSSLKISFPRVPNLKRTSLAPSTATTTSIPEPLGFSPATGKTVEVTASPTAVIRQTQPPAVRDVEVDRSSLAVVSALPDWKNDDNSSSSGLSAGGDTVDSRGDTGSIGTAIGAGYAVCESSSETLGCMTPNRDLLGEVRPDCVNKKCLVLDLDETLVHSWFKYVDNANFVVPVEIDGNRNQIYVCKRPHLDEFLQAVGPLFECVMFTASLKVYADPVCDYIDKAGHFDHRLFRESCVYHQNNFIKDISLLGRDVDQICIVDNSPVSFLFQPDNALQIVSWFDDPNDRALLELIPYLTALAKSDTVVDYLREYQPPANAAIAQPCTPAWLLYYPTTTATTNTSGGAHAIGEQEEQMASVAGDQSDYGRVYSEQEDAVLSPHFHPPLGPPSSAAATVQQQQQQQYLPMGHYHRVNGVPFPASSSFVHQVTQPSE